MFVNENLNSADDSTGGKAGTYLEIGGQTDPTAGGIGLGAFHYNYRYLSTRLAIYVLGSESIDDTFLGADTGIRFELGTAVSPFIGLGGYYGYHVQVEISTAYLRELSVIY